MSNYPPTVDVTPLEHHNALLLRWAAWINEFDIPPAFHALTAALNAASLPVHVIVDLTKTPNLPLATTINETLIGPFMHPMMGEWLVVGSNHRAEIIANTIVAVGRRKNLHWFDTFEMALEFLRIIELRETARRVGAFDGV